MFTLQEDKALTYGIIGAAIEIHRNLGPGLLEAFYEQCLAKEFVLREIPYVRQKPIPLVYKDLELELECGYRLDFLVAGRVVVGLKSIDAIAPIHDSVMLTYLRLSEMPLGLLINFNVVLLKTAFDATFGTMRKRITQRRRGPQRLADVGALLHHA
jgi:GxxExxY protein